jgi:tRNA(fMet)-specific endonuclease VapC
MIYLLDSNVCIQYLRGRNVLIQQRLAAKLVQEIRRCTVVLAELYVGVLRSPNPGANRASVDAFAGPYLCLPFDQAAADEYARIRHHLEMLGTPIGPYDLQIGAIALANGCTLVTHNTGEFSRVPGLQMEDWETP